MLNIDDFIKIEEFMKKLIDPLGFRMDTLESEFHQFRKTQGTMMDILLDIKVRLDKEQLPFIINQVNENTKDISGIKKFVGYTD